MKKIPYLVRKIRFDTKYSGFAKAAFSGPKTRNAANPGPFRAFFYAAARRAAASADCTIFSAKMP